MTEPRFCVAILSQNFLLLRPKKRAARAAQALGLSGEQLARLQRAAVRTAALRLGVHVI